MENKKLTIDIINRRLAIAFIVDHAMLFYGSHFSVL